MIRCGEASDFDELCKTLNDSFLDSNPTGKLLQDKHPHIISNTEEKIKQWLVVVEDGRIASGLQVVPRLLKLDKVTLPSALIGNVFTHPDFQGRGYISQLFKKVEEVLNEQKIPLSYLSGDRFRYQRYGWEKAGWSRLYQLSSFAASKSKVNDAVRRFEGREEDIVRMYEAFSSLKYREERTLDAYHKVLPAREQVRYIAERGSKFAYLSLVGNYIAEWAGDVQALEALLTYFAIRGDYSLPCPSVHLGPEIESLLWRLSERYSKEHMGMIKIHNLDQVLDTFSPFLSEMKMDSMGEYKTKVLETLPESCPTSCALFGPHDPHTNRHYPCLPIFWHLTSQ